MSCYLRGMKGIWPVNNCVATVLSCWCLFCMSSIGSSPQLLNQQYTFGHTFCEWRFSVVTAMVRWSPRRARLVLGWATVSICYLPSRPTQPSILTGSVIEEWRICKWVTEVGQVREGDVTAAHDIQCVLSAGSRPLKLRSLLPHRADCVRVYSLTGDICLSF